MVNDTRGHVSELLAKCIRQGALDQELSLRTKSACSIPHRTMATLSPTKIYKGTERSGYKVLPGAGPQDGRSATPSLCTHCSMPICGKG